MVGDNKVIYVIMHHVVYLHVRYCGYDGTLLRVLLCGLVVISYQYLTVYWQCSSL